MGILALMRSPLLDRYADLLLDYCCEVAPGEVVSLNVGWPWKADNSKIQRELGIRFRPLEQTLTEMFEQLAEAGRLKK